MKLYLRGLALIQFSCRNRERSTGAFFKQKLHAWSCPEVNLSEVSEVDEDMKEDFRMYIKAKQAFMIELELRLRGPLILC